MPAATAAPPFQPLPCSRAFSAPSVRQVFELALLCSQQLRRFLFAATLLRAEVAIDQAGLLARLCWLRRVFIRRELTVVMTGNLFFELTAECADVLPEIMYMWAMRIYCASKIQQLRNFCLHTFFSFGVSLANARKRNSTFAVLQGHVILGL